MLKETPHQKDDIGEHILADTHNLARFKRNILNPNFKASRALSHLDQYGKDSIFPKMAGLGRRNKVTINTNNDTTDISAWADQPIQSAVSSKKGKGVRMPSNKKLRTSANFDKKSDGLPNIMKIVKGSTS